jgi:hypothetical protein
MGCCALWLRLWAGQRYLGIKTTETDQRGMIRWGRVSRRPARLGGLTAQHQHIEGALKDLVGIY